MMMRAGLFALALTGGLMAAPAPVARPGTADVVLGIRNSKDMQTLASHLQSAKFLKDALALVPDVATLKGKEAAKWLRGKLRVLPSETGVRVVLAASSDVDSKDALLILQAIADQHLADRNPNRGQQMLMYQNNEAMVQQKLVMLGGGFRGGKMIIDESRPSVPKDREGLRNYMRQLDMNNGDGVVVQQPGLDSAGGVRGRMTLPPIGSTR